VRSPEEHTNEAERLTDKRVRVDEQDRDEAARYIQMQKSQEPKEP
jgi:hypothetical protein